MLEGTLDKLCGICTPEGVLVEGGPLLCSNSLLLKFEYALDEIIDLLSDMSASGGIFEDWRGG